MENTACSIHEACLLLGCLTIDFLLLSAILCCGDMFTGPLPSNGSIRHNMITGPPGWGLDARLTALLCKEFIVAKSKEVETG
jgi:hypothetical protein